MDTVNAKKEMDDHLLACQPFLKESHIVSRIAKEQAFCKLTILMTFHFLERLTVITVRFCSVSENANFIIVTSRIK
jgi:hypothetical protein